MQACCGNPNVGNLPLLVQLLDKLLFHSYFRWTLGQQIENLASQPASRDGFWEPWGPDGRLLGALASAKIGARSASKNQPAPGTYFSRFIEPNEGFGSDPKVVAGEVPRSQQTQT